LARRRQRFQDLLDVGLKAHVQHAVGFVEHDHADTMHPECTALQVVDEAPGSTDGKVHALLECPCLIAHGLSPRKHDDRKSSAPAPELSELAGDLRAELARWAKHETLELAR
jgi:hypothetical protein